MVSERLHLPTFGDYLQPSTLRVAPDCFVQLPIGQLCSPVPLARRPPVPLWPLVSSHIPHLHSPGASHVRNRSVPVLCTLQSPSPLGPAPSSIPRSVLQPLLHPAPGKASEGKGHSAPPLLKPLRAPCCSSIWSKLHFGLQNYLASFPLIIPLPCLTVVRHCSQPRFCSPALSRHPHPWVRSLLLYSQTPSSYLRQLPLSLLFSAKHLSSWKPQPHQLSSWA